MSQNNVGKWSRCWLSNMFFIAIGSRLCRWAPSKCPPHVVGTSEPFSLLNVKNYLAHFASQLVQIWVVSRNNLSNFLSDSVVLESIYYRTRAKWRIYESNTTGWLRTIWTVTGEIGIDYVSLFVNGTVLP